MYTLNVKGKIIVLERPLIMGILNATTDSFYEGHLDKSTEQFEILITKMITDGADIIDVGGQSTRPGSSRVAADEEASRVVPVIKLIKAIAPHILVSIDSFNAPVVRIAVDAGADIVNDVSGGLMDEDMLTTVGKLNVPYICMHMVGTPQTMVQNTSYDNLLAEMLQYFNLRIVACRQAGIRDIIIDPGFGFSKTAEQNFTVLNNLEYFQSLGFPLLAGLSRKRTIWQSLKIKVEEALNGTTVLNTIALTKGAQILRVHDVREAAEAIELVGLIYKHNKSN